jgi:hypothetical protein
VGLLGLLKILVVCEEEDDDDLDDEDERDACSAEVPILPFGEMRVGTVSLGTSCRERERKGDGERFKEGLVYMNECQEMNPTFTT